MCRCLRRELPLQRFRGTISSVRLSITKPVSAALARTTFADDARHTAGALQAAAGASVESARGATTAAVVSPAGLFALALPIAIPIAILWRRRALRELFGLPQCRLLCLQATQVDRLRRVHNRSGSVLHGAERDLPVGRLSERGRQNGTDGHRLRKALRWLHLRRRPGDGASLCARERRSLPLAVDAGVDTV